MRRITGKKLLSAALLSALACCEGLSDQALSDEIRLRFSRDPVLGSLPIYVTTHDGIAYLRGLASTSIMIQRAGQVAESVPGVRKVDNEIAIENPGRLP